MSEFTPILLTLPSSLTPSLAVEVLPYGLTVHKFFVQAGGRTNDIVIGPELPQDHVTQKYTNTIIGRYSNRIPVGTYTIERNGITSEFKAVPNENPRVSLHGGPKGFDASIWKVVSADEPATLFSPAELSHLKPDSASSHAIFRLISPDGDQGYPGKLLVEVLFSLIEPDGKEKISVPAQDVGPTGLTYGLGSLVIVYRAKLVEGGRKTVTPVNLTQHWGFNLSASLKQGPETLTVKDHILTIKSNRIAELGQDSLSTGSYVPAPPGSVHSHIAKRIGDQFPEKGYDDFYALDSNENVVSRIPLPIFTADFDILKDILRPLSEQPEKEPLVELSSSKSGLSVAFESNQQGVMFYANNLAQESSGARKKIHGGSGISGHGDSYGPGTAAFLEFHNPLAAFLEAANKNDEDGLLTTDELYHNYVRCDVKFTESRD